MGMSFLCFSLNLEKAGKGGGYKIIANCVIGFSWLLSRTTRRVPELDRRGRTGALFCCCHL